MNNELLRHTVAAIRYRLTKAIAQTSDGFGEYKVSAHTRTPNEIINHMTDLALKATMMVEEGHFNSPAPPSLTFTKEVARFNDSLTALSRVLEAKELDPSLVKKLLQGPILDMATHVGQIAMLNGLNGNKVPNENYFAADLKNIHPEE
ncbi:hypothetical protein RT717_04790 [Imperialibacter roseus]|uniref:DinB family protein n=1 Tax=Imperialibacter roseus TaxID=1324217 RepID=A0ABZ0IVH7_9BACT|nr:hypothetical protein [Imperialibacter roseus]WOK07945.1 hypothetical protein RT717_04790 [Imperialibacter roseus]